MKIGTFPRASQSQRSESPSSTGLHHESLKTDSVQRPGLELLRSSHMKSLLENISRSLDSPTLKKGIPLLLLVKELPLQENGLPQKSSDTLLLSMLLKKWRLSVSSQLKGETLKELEKLEQILDSKESVPFFIRSENSGLVPIRVEEGSSKEKKKDRKNPELELFIDLPTLGKINAVLSLDEGAARCRFHCDRSLGKRNIRRSLGVLRSRFKERGFFRSMIHFAAFNSHKVQPEIQNGIDLWG